LNWVASHFSFVIFCMTQKVSMQFINIIFVIYCCYLDFGEFYGCIFPFWLSNISVVSLNFANLFCPWFCAVYSQLYFLFGIKTSYSGNAELRVNKLSHQWMCLLLWIFLPLWVLLIYFKYQVQLCFPHWPLCSCAPSLADGF
jgi:hypothetical protein